MAISHCTGCQPVHGGLTGMTGMQPAAQYIAMLGCLSDQQSAQPIITFASMLVLPINIV